VCIAETKQAAGPDLTTQCSADAGRGATTALLDHIIGKQHQQQQQQLEQLEQVEQVDALEQVYHSPGGECSELYATVLDDIAGSSDHHHHHHDDHQQQQLEALDHLDHLEQLEQLEQVYHSPGGECSELYATVLDDGAGSSDHHHPDDHLIDPDCLLTQVSPVAARLPDGRLSNKPFLM